MSESEAALARAVLIHGPVSRSDLTRRLGLSPASLTRLAKPLLESGLLVEREEVADGSVGRPSRPLDIAPGLGTFAGVKITGDAVIAVGTDIRAGTLAVEERALDDRAPAAVLGAVVAAVTALALDDLVAVGVSLGGVVHDGVAVFAPFLDWRDVDVRNALETALGVPVHVENDVVALAEAERWFGAGRGLEGFATVTIGAGVGYGLVVAGEVVRTPDATTGTGGHIPLDPYGPVCSDGHRGCAQAMLSSGSITAQVSAALGRTVDYDETLRLAASDDPAVRTIVGAAGSALGTLIALAANLSLQSSIVLAGEGIALFGVVQDRVRAAIAAGRDPQAQPLDIHVDDSGFRAWARGAAAVAIQASMERMRSGRG
ncbi:putative NBD/HSP70 family sugar kinase [Microbacterium marinum]|uniref:Putative NBD/HSP70 family sugar kinase n=1 Tax=Microbacterium marinum TaxID=421115 RepID=A0A7W7BMG3_9MICO|nr:ROK family transcriptional regulator [Microbacterium marinum]MBB4665365.1 putative NBD/HSP70 family sugar kinase [Microbacterium marinum]